MATIGNIVLGLKVASGPFKKDLDKAAGSVKAFANTIVSAKGMIVGFGAALAGAFAVKAVISTITDTIDKIDELADTASRLDTTTEALTRLHYAAELNSSSAATMDGALQKLTTTLGKIDGEGGAAGEALAKMGLSANQLKNMDVTEAFKLIAANFGVFKTGADQAAAATALFGKTGVELVDVLRLGADGLEEMAKKSDIFGNTITQQSANQIAQAKDAMTQMGMVFSGIKNVFVSEVAPLITALSNRFLNWVEENGGFGEVIAKGVEIASLAIAGLVDMLDSFLEKMKDIGAKWDQFSKVASFVAKVANPGAAIGGALVNSLATKGAAGGTQGTKGPSAVDRVKGFASELEALRAKAKEDAANKEAEREKKRKDNKAAENTKAMGDKVKGIFGAGGTLASGLLSGLKNAGGLIMDSVRANPVSERKKDTSSMSGDFESKFGAATEFGSAEAMIAELQNRGGGNPMDKLQKTNEDQLKVAKDSDRNLERLVSNLGKLTGFPIK